MEEITLNKIDELRERTGLNYRDAKDLLEKSKGNVLDACIEWESKRPDPGKFFEDLKSKIVEKAEILRDKAEDFSKKFDESNLPNKLKDFKASAGDKAGKALDIIKKLIKEGNINRVRIKHNDKVIAEVPIALGALAAVILPELAVIGILIASFKGCHIEVVKKDGSVEQIKTDED